VGYSSPWTDDDGQTPDMLPTYLAKQQDRFTGLEGILDNAQSCCDLWL
jgi:hypothetical protein